MHVDGLAGAHRLHPMGVEGMERKRQQVRLFFGESLDHGPGAIVGPGAPVRHLIPPHQCLAIALRQCGEHAPRPERIPYIPNGSFHGAFGEKRALQTVVMMAQKFSLSRTLFIR